jgi:archaellum component FlaF (FlaF/FlaG flagellin family)
MSVFKSYKTVIVLALILFISLILNVFYLYVTLINSKTKIELINNKDLLNNELNEAKDEINKYKGLSDGLDTVIKQANLSIFLKESKIKNLIDNNELLGEENQKMLAEINEMKEKYINTIDSLLVERKINLKLNNAIISLESKISNLSKKLAAAEQLPIENIEVNPQKYNALGSSNQTALAKKAAEVQICYHIQPNKSTPSGKKVIFIRIFDPFGHFLYDKNLGNGEFFHPDYKMMVSYSITDTVDYKNEALEICTKWKNPENYISGTYLVELYTEKEAIGTTTFTLR